MTEAAESAKPDKRSMDEILASIRRIVADEEGNAGVGRDGTRASNQAALQSAAAPVVQSNAKAGADSSFAPQESASDISASLTASTSELPSGEDGVLDLIDVVAPDGSIVRIDHQNQTCGAAGQASVQHLAGAQEVPTTQFAAQPNSDQSSPKQETAQEPAASQIRPAAEAATLTPLTREQSTERATGQVIDPTDAAEIGLTEAVGATRPQPGAGIENVTSTIQTKTTRTEHADRTVYPDGQPASPDTRSIEYQVLEALVKRTLVPVLNEWLDKNMPAIVEKITAQEIRKIIDTQR